MPSSEEPIHGTPTSAASYSFGDLVVPLCWLCALIFCNAVIALLPWEPWADQRDLRICSPLQHAYPAWSFSLTSCWFSTFAHLFSGPSPSSWNTAMRAISCSSYLLASAALAHVTLRSRWARIMVCLIVVTSLYPFVWLSSELVVGALLMAALLAVGLGRPWVAGVSVSLFAFAKPDALLTAAVLLGVRLWRDRAGDRREHLQLMAAAAASCVVLLLPGITTYGLSYLSDMSRAGDSFGQHAHILFSRTIVWTEGHAALERYFPGAETVTQAAIRYPRLYSAYVLLSLLKGCESVLFTLGKPLLCAVPVVWIASRIARPKLSALVTLSGWTIIGLVPMVLLSYPHLRYFARFMPFLIIAMTAVIEQLWRPGSRFGWKLSLPVTAIYGFGCVAFMRDGVIAILNGLGSPSGTVFWSAD